MKLVPHAVIAELEDAGPQRVAFSPGPVGVGDVVVTSDLGRDGVRWSVANGGDRPLRVRGVAIELTVRGISGPLRLFRNGYQSWSPCDTAVVGVDTDPSARADRFATFRGAHHADQRRAAEGEVRSEWVTVLADDRSAILLGAIGGSHHDVTFRARPGEDSTGSVAVVEAHLGGARLDAGEERVLHDVRIDDGGGRAGPADAPALLETWAALVGAAEHARVRAPYQVGWCSWYHYFHDVTERDIAANLARARDWPFDVFQVDDGYQSTIGDWLDTNDTFPSGVARLASDIAAAGLQPGIWLAPFLVAPDSRVAAEHPGWLARHASGRPLAAWRSRSWDGGQDGVMWAIDTTHPEVQAHLEALGRELTELGFTYLKLDFTFAPSLDGIWDDDTRTPAERVRAGYEAVRRGAGDDAFLLGCGVPLAHVVGLVDANRIGQDVAPEWILPPERELIPGYLETQPAVAFAIGNTIARSFMHRRLWLNDPDCLMLRTEQTQLSPAEIRRWAEVVATSGGLALVSDDLALLGDDARALLADVIDEGRASDQRAIDGAPARATDLMASRRPASIASGPVELHVDVDRRR
jgi:alpha-galactosidase